MDNYLLFISFVERALFEISDEYYTTQFDNFYSFRSALRNFGMFNDNLFYRYSERGFAYELYYKLRKIIDEHRSKESFFENHFLQGEIKKMDIQDVVSHFNYERLGSHYIPDVLFHVPAQNDNAFVIEIKAQPELDGNDILNDLDKLSRFLNRFNYKKAIFIAVNIQNQNVVDVIRNNERQIKRYFTINRLNDCNIITRGSIFNDTTIFNQTLSDILK